MLVLLLTACRSAPVHVPIAAPTIELPQPVVVFESPGMRFEIQEWRAGAEHGRAWRVAFPRDARVTVAPSAHVVPFSQLLPDDAGPWAALNGGFYDQDAPMGLVVSGGVESTPISKGGGSGVLQWGPSPAAILHRDAWMAGSAEAIQSIDRLVDGGASLVTPRVDAPRAARSVVALSENNVWFIVVAAGASIEEVPGGVQLHDTSGQGPTLAEIADYVLATTGAQAALNLDGAVSTQMVIQGDQRFEVRGERGTINAVIASPRRP